MKTILNIILILIGTTTFAKNLNTGAVKKSITISWHALGNSITVEDRTANFRFQSYKIQGSKKNNGEDYFSVQFEIPKSMCSSKEPSWILSCDAKNIEIFANSIDEATGKSEKLSLGLMEVNAHIVKVVGVKSEWLLAQVWGHSGVFENYKTFNNETTTYCPVGCL